MHDPRGDNYKIFYLSHIATTDDLMTYVHIIYNMNPLISYAFRQ